MRLYVCPFSTEELLDAVDSELLRLVYYFATTIVALTRIAFCILVGHAATHSLHDFFTDKVLRGNELNTLELSLTFLFNQSEDSGVVHSFLRVIVWMDIVE